ncbi:MAG: hypothetical protein ACXVAY_01565 [Mucilaginibacter sp.]
MTIKEIVQAVCDATGFEWEAILSAKRGTPEIKAKYVAFLLMYDEEAFEDIEVTDTFGMDRTWIYWALDRTSSLIVSDDEFKKMYLDSVAMLAKMEECK